MDATVTMLLASQPGEGFTSSRWLTPLSGGTLLGQAVQAAAAWPVPLGLVVLGADAEPLVAEVDFGAATVLIDPQWHEGEAASLRAGLDYLQRSSEVEAIVLADADTPQVAPDVVAALLEAHARSGRPAAVPKYRYSRGRPVIVAREVWPRLLGLEGSVGPEAVLATHERWVEEVWFDQLPPVKVTSPDDLVDLRRRR